MRVFIYEILEFLFWRVYVAAAKDKNALDLEPPDLWFHDQMEAKAANKSDDADEMTSMMKVDAARKPKTGKCYLVMSVIPSRCQIIPSASLSPSNSTNLKSQR